MINEIWCSKTAYGNRIDLYLVNKLREKTTVCTEVVMEERNEGEYVQPSLSVDNKTAQMLMDELWKCGIRPTEGSGSAGSLAATEKHLEDMREVAFAVLRKQGVQIK